MSMREYIDIIEAAQSETFDEWFADSKVVDRSGKPLKVYHGSPDVRDLIANGFKPSMHRGEVYFFTDSYAVANTYADERRAWDYQAAEPHTIAVYLSMKNPLVIDGRGEVWSNTEHHINDAKEQGHDGIIIRNTRDEYNSVGNGGRLSTVYAVFSTDQIMPADRAPLTSRVDRAELRGRWLNGE